MKKVLLLALCLTLLCGCGKGEENHIRHLQACYADAQKIAVQAEIISHFDGGSRSFTVATVWEPQGATTTVVAPEEIAGISATVTGEEMMLAYDGAALSAGVPMALSPAACIPYLMRAVSEGYLLEYGSETLDERDCLRAAFDTTAPDGTKILCTVWLERESGAPYYTEFSTDGMVVLTIRALSFDMT